MNFGFNTQQQPRVNAFQTNKGTMGQDQSAASMQFVGYDNVAASAAPQERETFDLKTIQMPKMVVTNAP